MSVRGYVIVTPFEGGVLCQADFDAILDQAETFHSSSYAPLSNPNPFAPGVFELDSEADIAFLADPEDPSNLLAAIEEVAIACCPGDATGDGAVNLADLNFVLARFGQPAYNLSNPNDPNPSGGAKYGDVSGDGFVNLQDLNLVLANFGSDCTTGESKSFSMSTSDPQELPVTVWLMLKDHPNASAWIDQLSHFEPIDQAEDTSDLKEWVDDWEGDSPD